MIKDYIKKTAKSSCLKSILLIILSLFLIIKPIKTINVLVILLGVIILIDGVIDFINYFRSDKETKLYSFDLLEGILEALFGTLILINPESLITFLPIMLGVWIIVKNIFKLQIAINLKQIPNSKWYLLLILSILLIIFGIVIIINPFSATITLSLLIGITLLLTEIINLIECIYFIIKLKSL